MPAQLPPGTVGSMRARVVAAVLAAAALPAAASPVVAAPDGSPCFGAASLDPLHRCHDAALARVVEPTPDQATTMPNAPCVLHRVAGLSACGFGSPPDAARATVALIGDSHAGHWRAALAAVADAHHWHGVPHRASSR